MSRAFRAYKFVLLCGEAATDLHAGYYTLVEVRIRSILYSHSARWQWSFVFPNHCQIWRAIEVQLKQIFQ